MLEHLDFTIRLYFAIGIILLSIGTAFEIYILEKSLNQERPLLRLIDVLPDANSIPESTGEYQRLIKASIEGSLYYQRQENE